MEHSDHLVKSATPLRDMAMSQYLTSRTLECQWQPNLPQMPRNGRIPRMRSRSALVLGRLMIARTRKVLDILADSTTVEWLMRIASVCVASAVRHIASTTQHASIALISLISIKPLETACCLTSASQDGCN